MEVDFKVTSLEMGRAVKMLPQFCTGEMMKSWPEIEDFRRQEELKEEFFKINLFIYIGG